MRSYDPETLKKVQTLSLNIFKDFARVCEKHNIGYFAISGTAIGAQRHAGFIPWDDDIDIAMLREDYDKFVEVAPSELGDKYYLMGPEFDAKYYNLKPHMVLKDTVFVTDEAWASGYKPGFFLDLFVYENIPEDEQELKKYARQCKVATVLWFAYHVRFYKLLDKEKSLAGKAKYLFSSAMGAVLRLIPGCEQRLWKRYSKLAAKYRGKTNRYSALTDYGMTYMYVDRDEIYPYAKLPFEDTQMNLIREYKVQSARHMGTDYMQVPPEEKRTNHCPRELDFGTALD